MSGSGGGTKWGTKIVLIVLAVGCGVGAWIAKEQQPTAAAEAEARATGTAATYLDEDLTAAMKHWSPGDDQEKLRRQLEDGVLTDSDVTAVRLFDTAGTLVFSSVADDDATIDPSVTTSVLAGEHADASDDTTLRTYGPVAGLIGEVDQDAGEIRDAATLPWLVVQFGLFAVAIVMLGGAMFAGNGTKAPKEHAATPKDEPVKQTKKDLDSVDPETKKLLARAEKAEHSRRAMEDQLNVLRSQILSGDSGSQARIAELEGHLKDAHARVSDAEDRNVGLQERVAQLETVAAGSGAAGQRTAALETEVVTARARIKELEGLVKQLEARAARAETTNAAHSGQLDEAHTKARQAELQVQEAVDRALAAERGLEELRARAAAPSAEPSAESRTAEDPDATQRLRVELADAESRATAAEAKAARASARAAELAAAANDPAMQSRVRDLEIALADARAEAWAAEGETEGPSLGIVETHAVPDDDDDDQSSAPQVAREVDETDAIRQELERMAHVVEHAGEAGDVDGLRDRLTKSAARKKGRSVGDERLARPS
jgi:hypothetical protein